MRIWYGKGLYDRGGKKRVGQDSARVGSLE